MIMNELKDILKNSYEVDFETINDDTNLREYLDSIDFLNFLLEVKKKYQIDIQASEVENMQTLKQIVEIVTKLVS